MGSGSSAEAGIERPQQRTQSTSITFGRLVDSVSVAVARYEEGGFTCGSRRRSIGGPSHCTSDLVLKSVSGVWECLGLIERSEEGRARPRCAPRL